MAMVLMLVTLHEFCVQNYDIQFNKVSCSYVAINAGWL